MFLPWHRVLSRPANNFRSHRMLRTHLAAIIALAVFTWNPCRATAQGRPMPSRDAGNAVGGSAFHKNDITYSTAVATPHVPWATRLAGGPIRGFFIPSVEFGRD